MMIKNLYKSACILVLLSFCGIASAQLYQPPVFIEENRMEKIKAAFPVIDRLFKKYAEENHFPALVHGIVVDGKLVHAFSTGYTDVAKKTPATSRSAFRIASMTKSITAMAVLKLRDEGRLRLDDPAHLYIPEMKNIPYLTKGAPAITIRHLLTHAAGFPEDNPWGDRQLARSDEELLGIYKKGVSFSTNPGAGYEYSNLGFATLGLIIKNVSGKTYQQYINENILAPLGMNDTYWEYANVPQKSLAHGYRWMNDEWVEQPLLHDGSYGAMGGLISTVEDFSKYMALHLSAWPENDSTERGPLKQSSIREMHLPWNVSFINRAAKKTNGQACATVSAYGYGLSWTKDCENKITIAHSGGLPGFGSQWRILPEYGIGIVSFANLTYARAGYANALAMDTLLALSGIKPRQLPPSAILQKRKNELIKLLPHWKDAAASGIFADNFFADYFPEQLSAEATAAFAKAGKIIGVKELVPENQLRGYFILEGEKGNIRVSFTLTPEHVPLIQEYHLHLLEKE